MPSADPVDWRRPPRGFDPLVEWWELASLRLVLLDDVPLEEVRAALRQLTGAVQAHCAEYRVLLDRGDRAGTPSVPLLRILSADHDWFATSLEQLWWFYGIVERENHGGHRQALGQYGRVLAESLRRHRSDEQAFLGSVPDPAGSTGGVPLPKKP